MGFQKHFTAVFLMIFSLFAPALEAAGWGKTNETVTYANIKWNSIYIDLGDLRITGLIPNYSGARLSGGEVQCLGSTGKNVGYVVKTSMGTFDLPFDTLEEFISLIQNANPTFTVFPVDTKNSGGIFAIDVLPDAKDNSASWRVIATNNRLIWIGTDESKESIRSFFFNSVKIQE